MLPDPSPETWIQIRYEYEHTDKPVDDICLDHGVSPSTLRERMRRWRWTRRRQPISAQGPPPMPIAHGAALAPFVAPAIEAIVAQIAAGPMPPREMERAARALGLLTRTLRELNTLLAEQPVRGHCDCEDIEDIDAFRIDLARRINAFVASKTAEGDDGAAPP